MKKLVKELKGLWWIILMVFTVPDLRKRTLVRELSGKLVGYESHIQGVYLDHLFKKYGN